MFESIVVYGIMLFSMIFLAKQYGYTNKVKFYFFFILSYSIIMGCRYGVGVDYYSYLDCYNMWSLEGEKHFLHFGVLFSAFTTACDYLNLHPVIYFTIISIVQILTIFSVVKYCKPLLPFAVFVFLATGLGISGVTNGIRQYLAVGVTVCSIKFIYEKRFIPFLVLIFIAFLFHKTALVVLPFFILGFYSPRFFKNVGLQLIVLITAYLIHYIYPDLFLHIFDDYEYLIVGLGFNDKYLTNEYMGLSSDGIGVMGLAMLLVDIVVILYSNKIKSKFSGDFDLINIIYIFWFIGVIGDTLFTGSLVFDRLFQYFSIYDIVIYPAAFLYYKCNKQLQAACLLLLFTFTLSFTRTIYYGDANTSRYVFYFQYDQWASKQREYNMNYH